jgi:hypothetical protein
VCLSVRLHPQRRKSANSFRCYRSRTSSSTNKSTIVPSAWQRLRRHLDSQGGL